MRIGNDANANLTNDAYFGQTVGNVAREVSVAQESADATNIADVVHTMLDDLETRLFGPEPRAVEQGSIKPGSDYRPALAHSVRATRQRLESASARLSGILDRL